MNVEKRNYLGHALALVTNAACTNISFLSLTYQSSWKLQAQSYKLLYISFLLDCIVYCYPETEGGIKMPICMGI